MKYKLGTKVKLATSIKLHHKYGIGTIKRVDTKDKNRPYLIIWPSMGWNFFTWEAEDSVIGA